MRSAADMGNCYDRRGRLCCDQCGQADGVRKCTCPYKVLTDSSRAPRTLLAYCKALALCGPCLKELGGRSGVHKNCAAEAESSQAEFDAVEARLEAGGSYVQVAWGVATGVPDGMTGVMFSGRGGKTWVLVPGSDYDPGRKPWLADYPQAVAWTGHPS